MSKKMQFVVAGVVFLALIALWLGMRHEKTEADEDDTAAAGQVRRRRGAGEARGASPSR